MRKRNRRKALLAGILTRSESAWQPDHSEWECRRDLTVRSYSVKPETVNDTERSVEAVMASETPCRVFDMNAWGFVDEVLCMSGCRMPADGQMPLLDTHDRSSVEKLYGSARGLKIEGDKLVGRNVFSSDPTAQRAFTKVKEGHLRDNSIGYRVIKYVMVKAGQSGVVDGRTFTASPDRDLRVTTEWEPRENSVCPIGADQTAKVRTEEPKDSQSRACGAAAPAATPPQNPITGEREGGCVMGFEAWLTSRGFKAAELKEEQRAALKTAYDAEQRAEADKNKSADKIRKEAELEGQRIERERVSAIRAEAKDLADVKPETVERCIKDGLTVEAAREAFLSDVRAARKEVPGASIEVGGSAPVTREAISAAMMLRVGIEPTEAVTRGWATQKAVDASAPYRAMRLSDLARECLRLDGQRVEGYVSMDTLVARASSTASFSNILADVAHKAALVGFQQSPATFPVWAKRGRVSDFKVHKRVGLTDVSRPGAVNRRGELLDAEIGDKGESIQAVTKGFVFGLSRQDIINDDLSVLSEIPRRMAARFPQEIDATGYELLISNPTMSDSVALFDSAHGNLIGSSGRAWYLATDPLFADTMEVAFLDGKDAPVVERFDSDPRYLGVQFRMYFDAGVAALGHRGMVCNLGVTMDASGLNAAIVKLMRQTDKKGTKLNLPPRYLIVAPEDAFAARQLVTSSTLLTVTGTNATLANTGTANPLAGLGIKVVETAFLAAS